MSEFIRQLFTGPDNKTWAIGRVYSLPVLLTGLAVPIIEAANARPVDLANLGLLLPGTAAAVMALVTGTNSTEPKP